jgi:hypothetical protein
MTRENLRDSILAILILAVPVALWLTLDEALLEKLAFAALGLGVAGVFALRKYLGRVDRVMTALADPKSALAFPPLSPLEQQLLGIRDLTQPERIKRELKRRSELFVSIATGFAVCALIGFIVLIVIYAD